MNPKDLVPHEMLISCMKTLLLAISGAAGVFIRQINATEKSWSHRALELFCGALCAIYGAEVLAHALYHFFTKKDLVSATQIDPQTLFGLSGFLCGALGISVINALLTYVKYVTKIREK